MAARKGEPRSPKAGRKKGTPNKSSIPAQELAEKLGINPFEILLRFAAGDWQGLGYENECYFAEKPDGAVKMGYVISPEARAKASAEATKYLMPQRKAVEISTEGDKGFKIIVEDYSSKDKK